MTELSSWQEIKEYIIEGRKTGSRKEQDSK